MSELKYQSILDRSAAANASYLVATLSISDNQRAEVVVEDIARMNGAGALDVAAIQALGNTALPLDVCERRIIVAAYVTSVKNRIFNKVTGSGAVNGLAFGAGADVYASSENFSRNLVLAIDARPIRAGRMNDSIVIPRPIERILRMQ